jgi:hypothetical protein
MTAPALLAQFESYGPQVRRAALDHFGKSIEEIEAILGKPSPDEELRDVLGLMLWKYARGVAGRDGSGRERPSEIRHYLEALDNPARRLREALETLLRADNHDDASASTVAILLDAASVEPMVVLEQLGRILAVTEKAAAEKSTGGRPPDVEHGVLMTRAADVFELATGRSATVTSNPVHDTFGGGFFRMAELVDAAAASATGQQPKSNAALGGGLKKLRAARRSHDAKVQNPS